MKASDYTSSYATASDFVKPRLLNVEQVTEETIGNDTKPKLVMYCRDDDAGDEIKIALNKSNIDRLIEIFGDDETDNWTGQSVVGFRDPNVTFNNRKVGGIAFRKPKNGVSTSTKPSSTADEDSSVPF